MEKRDLEQEIINAARETFIHCGYTDASMTDIAKTVGINRPTLHYYFRTKDKLFNAVFGDIIKESIDQIRYIFHPDIPLLERLDYIIDSYYKHFKLHPDLPMFFLKEIQRNPTAFVSEIHQPEVSALLLEVMGLYHKEIEMKQIQNVPFELSMPAFYMLLITPFIGQRLMETPIFGVEFDLDKYLLKWKKYMLDHFDKMLVIHP